MIKETNVFFGAEAFQAFEDLLDKGRFSKLAFLVDSNTHEACYAPFMQSLSVDLPEVEVVEIPPGEDSKSLEVLANLWLTFGELGLDRNSLIVNLGGGVVCDLGGFAAATYMRGIAHINFPTSLLAMADAAVGAKTGINFGGYKNRVGAFREAQMVGIIPDFLQSLADEELKSGYAEMIKHALLAGGKAWENILSQDISSLPEEELIRETIAIKAAVVAEDQMEQGLRKVLNFGHSVGHALESYFSDTPLALSHGHAVALGMQVELLLSYQETKLSKEEFSQAYNYLAEAFFWPEVEYDKAAFLQLLHGDKKNRSGELRLVLLEKIGEPVVDQKVTEDAVWKALMTITNG